MISLCITTHQRTELLFESFREVIDDPRVNDIVIVDDCSDAQTFHTVAWYLKDLPKVRLFRNQVNIDCYRNKREAISHANNEWVIILDSDNILRKPYIDRIENLIVAGLNNTTIYQPSFAKPHFNFTKFDGLSINSKNVSRYMHEANFSTMLNAMNYFVHRDEYLKVWDGNIDPVTSDSIYQNYNWLNAGNSIYVVPDLFYDHRVHDGSHYQKNVRRTPRNFHKGIEDLLKQMV